MSKLILVRHGESEWNKEGKWTGITDIPLTEKGRREAKEAEKALKTVPIDIAFTTPLSRARETLDIILHTLNLHIPVTVDAALNEKDYGELTGKNKWKIKEEYGEEQFTKWRRSWDSPPPKGEALKDVYNRVIPYYKENIELLLKEGKNVMIVAHGNSLRALTKELENISDEDIPKLELATGEVWIYDVDTSGKILHKEVMKFHE